MILDEKKVENIVGAILSDYEDERAINKTDVSQRPDKEAIIGIVEKLIGIIYPGYYGTRARGRRSVKSSMAVAIEEVTYALGEQISIALRYKYPDLSEGELAERAEKLTFSFMEKIPQIRAYLETDVEAAFDGDPAASSKDEIILSYPGLFAVTVYRIAHELFLLEVPMLPRVMTEYAHSTTGIDIHPGATIGKYFFMDHGTGIVIGETTIIGEHVKVYQGVTLGGLSTKGGQKLKGVKRHPTIGDNVTIYSGASILGGETVIGADVVVGGNTFITESISKGTRVTAEKQKLKFKS